MPISKTTNGQDGRIQDILESTPKLETKVMNATMDAVDENLDKLSYALKDRFRKLVSSQISLMKYTTPNLHPVKVQVNIKHREIRKVCSPDVKSRTETNNEELSELQSEQRLENSQEVTTIHIKENYRSGEIPSNEKVEEDANTSEIDDDNLVNTRYQKVSYKKQLITRTSAESPEGSRKNVYNEAGNSSPRKSPLKYFESEDSKTVKYKNRSPILSKSPVLAKYGTRTADMIRNYDRSPPSGRSGVRSPLPTRNNDRNTTSTGNRNRSPTSARKLVESLVSGRNDVRSPASERRTTGSPTLKRNSLESPASLRNTLRSSPLSKGSARSPPFTRYDAGNSVLSNNGAESPVSVRRSPEYPSDLQFRNGVSRNQSRSPVLAKYGTRSVDMIRNYERSPILGRSDARSPLPTRSSNRNTTSIGSRNTSPTSTRKIVERSVLERNNTRSPVSARNTTGSPTVKDNSLESPTSLSGTPTSSSSSKDSAQSPPSTNYDVRNSILSRNGSGSPRSVSRSPSPPHSRTCCISHQSARSGTSSPLFTKNSIRSPTFTRKDAESFVLTRGATSPRVTRKDAGSPKLTRGAASPRVTRKDAGSPILTIGAASPRVARDDADSLRRKDQVTPMSSKDTVRSPPSSRDGMDSPIFASNDTGSLLVPRQDVRSLTDDVNGSPIFPSTAVCIRSLTSNRDINPVLPDRQSSAAVAKNTVPSPVGRRLQTMVNRLEVYNKRVSPKMEKIKESLSPRKGTQQELVHVAKRCMEERVASTELAKSYKRIDQTLVREEIPSPKYNDTNITRTRTKTTEHRVFTTSPRLFTYYASPTSTSVQSDNESFPKQYFNNYMSKAMTISRKEYCSNTTPVPDNGERKEKQPVTVSTYPGVASSRPGTVDHRRELQQLASPVSDDLSTQSPDVRRKLHFSSPTELPTYSSISHELEKDRDVSFGSVNVNDTQNSDHVSRSEDRNITQTTGSNRSFLSSRLAESGGESSTFLLESLDSINQRPLAHSTPIPEDSTVRYLSISPKPLMHQSDNSVASTADDDKKNFCASCYGKVNKQTRLFDSDIKHSQEHRDDRDNVQNYNKAEIRREYSKAFRKDQNAYCRFSSTGQDMCTERKEDLTRSRDASSVSERSESNKGRSSKGRYNNENETGLRTKRSIVTERVQKEMHDTDDFQKQMKVSRKTREVKQCGKGSQTSVTEEHQTVKELKYNGGEIETSSYTKSTQSDHGTLKHIRNESVHMDLTNKKPPQADVVKEQITLKEIKHAILQANQDNEKATQANITQEEHQMLKQLEYKKRQKGRDNEKVCQVNMTLEEQEVLKQLEPCCSHAEQRTEQYKHQSDGGKVEKACQREILEIREKSTTGSQTDIIEEHKRLIRHEQSSQTDIFIQSETSTRKGKTDGISFNTENEKVYKESIHCNANVEARDKKKVDIETLQRAYEDIQNRLHVSATATLVSAAQDALKKSIDSDFHRELWIALHDNVHRLHEDFERFMSTYMLPKDTTSSHNTVNEWEYKIQNRIETLLSLCNNLDRGEFRDHIEHLIDRLRSACFDQGAQSRAVQFTDEMKSLLSGLTNLTENFAVCGERLLGKTEETQCDDRIPESDQSHEFLGSQSCPSAFVATANKTVKKLLDFYSGRTRYKDSKSMSGQSARKDVSTTPRTLFGRLDAFLHRHMFGCVLIAGVLIGLAVATCGAPVARTVYKLILAGLMYVWCSVRLIHTNPPVV